MKPARFSQICQFSETATVPALPPASGHCRDRPRKGILPLWVPLLGQELAASFSCNVAWPAWRARYGPASIYRLLRNAQEHCDSPEPRAADPRPPNFLTVGTWEHTSKGEGTPMATTAPMPSTGNTARSRPEARNPKLPCILTRSERLVTQRKSRQYGLLIRREVNSSRNRP